MSDDERLRAMLTALREHAHTRVERFTASTEALAAARQGESDDDEHDPEGVTLSSEWSRLAGLLEGAKEELQQVDMALKRLRAGSYGVCAGCGNPIPPERLEVRPFADQCVPCASRQTR